jgi:hypothetical protein
MSQLPAASRRPRYPSWLPECCRDCQSLSSYDERAWCNRCVWFPTRKRTCKRQSPLSPDAKVLVATIHELREHLERCFVEFTEEANYASIR